MTHPLTSLHQTAMTKPSNTRKTTSQESSASSCPYSFLAAHCHSQATAKPACGARAVSALAKLGLVSNSMTLCIVLLLSEGYPSHGGDSLNKEAAVTKKRYERKGTAPHHRHVCLRKLMLAEFIAWLVDSRGSPRLRH